RADREAVRDVAADLHHRLLPERRRRSGVGLGLARRVHHQPWPGVDAHVPAVLDLVEVGRLPVFHRLAAGLPEGGRGDEDRNGPECFHRRAKLAQPATRAPKTLRWWAGAGTRTPSPRPPAPLMAGEDEGVG